MHGRVIVYTPDPFDPHPIDVGLVIDDGKSVRAYPFEGVVGLIERDAALVRTCLGHEPLWKTLNRVEANAGPHFSYGPLISGANVFLAYQKTFAYDPWLDEPWTPEERAAIDAAEAKLGKH